MNFNYKQVKKFRNLFLGSSSSHGLPLGMILLGTLFVIIAWTIKFIHYNQEISAYGIVQIHLKDISLILFDTLPFLFGFGGYCLEQFFKQMTCYYSNEIQKKETYISNNINIAQNLGNTEFNINNIQINNDDLLGKSLIKMRENLIINAQKEIDQNWIALGKEQIATILRLHQDINNLAYNTLECIVKYLNVLQGAFFITEDDGQTLTNRAVYAYNRQKYVTQKFKIGEGLIGQAAYEKTIVFLKEIPDNYATITSGLLKDQKPNCLVIVPLITNDTLYGILEITSLKKDISALAIKLLEELSDIIARTIFNLLTNIKTERLLKDAQIMTGELRENEGKLRQGAEEMRIAQEQLEETNQKLEQQIQAVEDSQRKIYSLLENASEVISIYDVDSKLTYISPSVYNIFGFTPKEMIAGKDFDRLTAKGLTEVNQMFGALLKKPKEVQTIQFTYLRKDGKKLYIEAVGRNLLHDQSIRGIVVNSQDVTERKRAEKEERMKSKMQALSENSIDFIMRLSPSGNIFYANPTVETITGINIKNIIGYNINETEVDEKIKKHILTIVVDVVKTKQKQNYEMIFPTQLGERMIQLNAIPEFTETEIELETILIVAHDITEQKKTETEIKEKNKSITESINYAERIQKALLPDIKQIHEYLPKSFVFYLPKDIVSGDFPWFFVKDDIMFVAAVDCTGHGVPGALLSFVGYFLLNSVAGHGIDLNAGQIMDNFHASVRKALKQGEQGASTRDGMDIAFCKIDMKNKKLQYTGAHRPLYMLRNNTIFDEFKGDKKAIGGIPLTEPEENFTNHEIKISKGDKIFFFSDGLPDQFGGPKTQKYQARRVREAIVEHSDYTMQQFHKFFQQDFTQWKGTNKQIDDVLLIGIEF